MDFDAPPDVGCMGGDVPPCGLSAGAPPEPVSSGPIHPFRLQLALVVGPHVRPVLLGESPGFLSSFVCALRAESSQPRRGACPAQLSLLTGNCVCNTSGPVHFQPVGQAV
jgi:hypothetical protein